MSRAVIERELVAPLAKELKMPGLLRGYEQLAGQARELFERPPLHLAPPEQAQPKGGGPARQAGHHHDRGAELVGQAKEAFGRGLAPKPAKSASEIVGVTAHRCGSASDEVRPPRRLTRRRCSSCSSTSLTTHPLSSSAVQGLRKGSSAARPRAMRPSRPRCRR